MASEAELVTHRLEPRLEGGRLLGAGAAVLVVADALGTVGYFTAPGEAIGVHPVLRLRPPRSLGELEPEHILCGHGAGVHGPAAAGALHEALATSRRRLPRALANGLRRRKS